MGSEMCIRDSNKTVDYGSTGMREMSPANLSVGSAEGSPVKQQLHPIPSYSQELEDSNLAMHGLSTLD